MEAFRARQFAKAKATPNTFIGGIAKQGGTGVNAPIDTPYKLSQKLGIAVNRITGFKVIGDDVECYISGTYTIPSSAFGNATDTLLANKNIKYYLDESGICLNGGSSAFSYCTELEHVKFMSWVSSFSNYVFKNCTKLTNAELNWASFTTISGQESFRNTGITSLNIPNVTTISGYGMFWHSKIATLNAPLLVSCGTYTFASTRISEFNCPLFTTFGVGSLKECNLLTEVTTIATAISNQNFQLCSNLTEYNNASLLLTLGNESFQNTKIPNFIANNVTSCGTSTFLNATMSLIELKKCKSLANEFVFNLASTGFTVKINVFLATSSGGSPHPALTYAKDNKSAIIEFYDDAGNYVSTL